MSRAGKFIPGGGAGKSARRTGPIRAPGADAPAGGTGPLPTGKPGERRSLTRGLVRPVSKSQKLPIVIMSGIVCCLLVSVAWYLLAYQPAMKQLAVAKQALADAQAAAQKQKEDQAQAVALAAQQAAMNHGTLTIDTNPSGAKVVIGDFSKTTPATFAEITPGDYTVMIHADGFEDYKQNLTITQGKTTDLGTVQLVPKAGDLSITTAESNVTYTVSGPNGYSHAGNLPDQLQKLPIGDYTISVAQGDWKLAPITVAIHDHDNIQKDIKFPYGNVTISSTPSNATVRQGNKILGQTPLTRNHLRPQDLSLTVDLPPYTLQRVTIHLPDFGNVTNNLNLQQDKDFIAASGIPLVWIPDGGYWAGKYDVRQGEYQVVAGNNPSTFRRPNRPVDTVSWDAAMAFCEKLNKFEQKAGKLPAGYHYTLPTEAQWEQFSADADLNQAAMSRMTTLSSTQDAGASEPNKYGLYDTLGNVWEWCLDAFDDKGNHSLRGGSWLSSPDNFPGADTRNGGAPKYADRFTGFRVVLVPNS